MIKHSIAILLLLNLSITYSEELMNYEMHNLKSSLEKKCKDGVSVTLTNELFSKVSEYDKFVSRLDSLTIAKPVNACDFLKRPQILSVVSALPMLKYEKAKDESNEEFLKNVEIVLSRKYYISKLIELRKDFPTIEQVSIKEQRALNPTDFYLKGLVACLDADCPYDLLNIFMQKISGKDVVVYGKNIKRLFLDERSFNSLSKINNRFEDSTEKIDYRSVRMKASILRGYSELSPKNRGPYDYQPYEFTVIGQDEWSRYHSSNYESSKQALPLYELQMDKFVSKNVIGFVRPEAFLGLEGHDEKVWKKVGELRKRYNSELFKFDEPKWSTKVQRLSVDKPFKKTEIEYEEDFYNVYGVVNSEESGWYLLKDLDNKEYWINQSQLGNSVSISTILLGAFLLDNVAFYESPEGTKTKKNSSQLLFERFKTKSFKWVKDQLWLLVETADFEPCDGWEEDEKKGIKTRVPVKDLWIKAFNEKNEFNFLHAARGC